MFSWFLQMSPCSYRVIKVFWRVGRSFAYPFSSTAVKPNLPRKVPAAFSSAGEDDSGVERGVGDRPHRGWENRADVSDSTGEPSFSVTVAAIHIHRVWVNTFRL